MSSRVHTFKIEERRRKVASLIAQSFTEEEIAQQLNVNQGTISRDIKALRQLSHQFVHDLAKSNLAHYYKQCIDGIEEVKRKAWEAYRSNDDSLKTTLVLVLCTEPSSRRYASDEYNGLVSTVAVMCKSKMVKFSRIIDSLSNYLPCGWEHRIHLLS